MLCNYKKVNVVCFNFTKMPTATVLFIIASCIDWLPTFYTNLNIKILHNYYCYYHYCQLSLKWRYLLYWWCHHIVMMVHTTKRILWEVILEMILSLARMPCITGRNDRCMLTLVLTVAYAVLMSPIIQWDDVILADGDEIYKLLYTLCMLCCRGWSWDGVCLMCLSPELLASS